MDPKDLSDENLPDFCFYSACSLDKSFEMKKKEMLENKAENKKILSTDPGSRIFNFLKEN